MPSTYLDRVSNKALGQMLVEKGALSEPQVNEALEVSKRKGIRLGEALVSLGYIGGDALSYAIAEQYGQRPMELHPSMIDPRLISRFDIEFLRRHNLLPLISLGEELVVVVGDPNDKEALQALAEAWPGGQIAAQLGAPAQITRCLDDFLFFMERQSPRADSVADVEPGELKTFEEAPALDSPQFPDWLLSTAARNWGSDLLVRQLDNSLQVAARDGDELNELGRWENKTPADALDSFLQRCKPVPFTDGQVHMTSPRTVDGVVHQFHIACPPTSGPAYGWIRALRQADWKIDGATSGNLTDLPGAGRIKIIEHDNADLPDLLVSQIAAAHAAKQQAVVISSAIRMALAHTPVYPAPFVDVAAAAQAHGATVVIFDFPPSAEAVSRLLASTQPAPPAIIILATAEESAATDSLANRPGTQRTQHSGIDNSAGTHAGVSADAEKGIS